VANEVPHCSLVQEFIIPLSIFHSDRWHDHQRVSCACTVFIVWCILPYLFPQFQRTLYHNFLSIHCCHRKLQFFASIQKQLIVQAIAERRDIRFLKCFRFVSIQKQSIVRVLLLGSRSYFVSAIAKYNSSFPSRNSRV
jgi:hypothetical protein